MPFQQAVELAISFAQMAAGVIMFASAFPLRGQHRALRACFAAAVIAACWFILSPILTLYPTVEVSEVSLLYGAFGAAAFWGIIPLGSFLLVLALTEAGRGAAAWCAAAGYTLQNLTSSMADFIELVLGAGQTENVGLLPTVAIELGVMALAYGAAWRLLCRPLRDHGFAAQGERGMFYLLGAVFVAVIMFDTVNKQLLLVDTPLALVLALKVVHAITCVFVLGMGNELLVSAHLREESAAAQGLLVAERRQYELSRENIEAINIKCHDIRHQIRRLGEQGAGAASPEVLEDIMHEVSIYDSLMHTGNDALDTILSEKGLICEREGIAFRCIADGTALSFMAPTDIYALFGNALDNAIEASRQIADASGRSISLGVRSQMGLASIHVENAFSGEVRFGENGLPLTSKADTTSHGFGTLSLRRIAERYGGTMTTRVTEGVFHLNLTLPQPEE